MKTGKQIQTDVLELIQGSPLADAVSGGIYRNGCRPRNSGKEDIVVTFTAGLSGQVSTGIVTVNIFVPDIRPYADGVMVEDMARTSELEAVAAKWVESLTADKSSYLWSLNSTITTSIDSIAGEHFVNVRLQYRLYDNN